MLSSPYPAAASRARGVVLALAWLAGVAVAPWIVIFPPITYEGLGLAASVGWGLLVGLGSLLIVIGQVKRIYQVELPGTMLAAVGLTIYALLSWQQVATGSTGSGARALILIILIGIVIARGMDLWAHHRRMRRLDSIAAR